MRFHIPNAPSLSVFLIVTLLLSACSTGKLDRSQKPEPGEAPNVSFSDYEKFTLDNGLTVFVVEDKQSPKVTYSLEIDRDPVAEGEKAGYVSLAGDMIGTETENRSKDELNEEVDFIGATLSTNPTGVYASALKKRKEKLLDLTADVIKNSTFSEKELKKKKKRMKSDIKSSEEDPGSIASKVFKKLIYGQDHPYADVNTVQSVDNVEMADLKKYYRNYYRPNISYLAVVGNTSKEEIKPLLEKKLGDWEEGDVPKHEYDQPEELASPKVAVVNRPNASQSTVRIGHSVDLQLSDDDYATSQLTNTILGGGAFRLFENLREEYSFTYGAYSGLSQDEEVGRFIAVADVKNSATDSAIIQMLHEMRRLRKDTVPTEELATAKNYITGNFAIGLEDPRTVARYAIQQEKNDLPKDFYENYLKQINNTTPGEVKAAAKKYIRPDQSHILVVGKAREFKDKLEQFGDVTYYDEYGNETAPPASKPAPEGMTANDVIDDYIKAIGGKQQLQDVQSLSVTYEAEIRGRKMKVVRQQKAPDLFKSVTKIGPMEMTQVYDGEKGLSKSMRGKKEITGAQLKRLKVKSTLFYHTKMDQLDLDASLKGIETVNGKEAYKVVFTMPEADKNWTEYFSTESGLRLGEKQTRKTQQGKQTQTTYYGDYKEKNGIKFPHRQSVDMGGQRIDIEATTIKVNPSLKDDDFAMKE